METQKHELELVRMDQHYVLFPCDICGMCVWQKWEAFYHRTKKMPLNQESETPRGIQGRMESYRANLCVRQGDIVGQQPCIWAKGWLLFSSCPPELSRILSWWYPIRKWVRGHVVQRSHTYTLESCSAKLRVGKRFLVFLCVHVYYFFLKFVFSYYACREAHV